MDRVERMDFTSHTWSEGFSLIVPRPEEESRLFAFIGPFQPTVSYYHFVRFINNYMQLFNCWLLSGLDADLY